MDIVCWGLQLLRFLNLNRLFVTNVHMLKKALISQCTSNYYCPYCTDAFAESNWPLPPSVQEASPKKIQLQCQLCSAWLSPPNSPQIQPGGLGRTSQPKLATKKYSNITFNIRSTKQMRYLMDESKPIRISGGSGWVWSY